MNCCAAVSAYIILNNIVVRQNKTIKNVYCESQCIHNYMVWFNVRNNSLTETVSRGQIHSQILSN